MLQLIRDRAQGIVIWTIVGLIIITFALFGLSSYLSDSSTASVATVNGVDIAPGEFQQAYQNYQQRLQQMLGKKYRPELFNENKIRKQVLESLIQQKLLNQELERAGYRAGPQQIVRRIASMKVFQEDGKFSPERYKQLLNSQRVNSVVFEKQIAQDLIEQQLSSGILLSGFVSDAELERAARLQNQKRQLSYILLPKSHYLKSTELTEKEIKNYFEQHKKEFTTPEKVSVEYVELNLDDMSRGVEVSDKAIAEYYAEQRQSFIRQPEQRKASHILIKVEKAAEESAALEKIKKIQQELAKGADFSKLAKKYSDDIGSARQGGELGYFGRGVMDKAFENAVFSLKKGEISKPIRSRFGYHLIKLEDIRKARVADLKDVKESIRHDLQNQQAEKSFYDTVDKLNNLSYEMPDSLAPVAEQLGLEVKKSPLFARKGGSGLFAQPKVVSAAFSDEVLSEGRNSQLIELSDTHVLVLRIARHEPAKQQVLNDVREQVKTQLRNEKVAERIKADSLAVLKKLRAGSSPEKLARALNAKWKPVGAVSRADEETDLKLDPQIRYELFQMPRPEKGKKVYKNVLLANGDGALLILSAVIEGKTYKDENKLNQRRKLIGTYGNAMQSAWMAELRKKADVTTNLSSVE
ncbi:Peptidyl-prolyl cis-trans isomerase PpiD [hydrothermal vent metagenome]|uniref:Periplasmic chaperone PpiD n=1 Tax=hydrothermal vent metagenome TaxID=652676 RepID=A0A3B1B4F2_9ZZZZ